VNTSTNTTTPIVSDAPDVTFDNRFVRELPGDPDRSNRRRQVLHAAWSAVLPTPVSGPQLLAHASEVAELVGLPHDFVQTPAFAQTFGVGRPARRRTCHHAG